MSALQLLALAVTHPFELRSLITYKVWRDPLNDIKSSPDSGWDRETMRDCWTLLDQTSRSFAAVIKELKGELGRVICLFYLVLRALDTVEDDMTIDNTRKVQLLRDFYKQLEVPGWNFTESGPNEKDRHLLVDFHKVIEEYQRLGPEYRVVISDITAKMGSGMASYILASSQSSLHVATFADYDLYCHFVAGLVGEGLSRLFGSSGIERRWLCDQLSLSNHMGLFLQKTNIIRDYAEDCRDGRFFWPAEGYKKAGFQTQADVARGIVPAWSGHFRPEGADGQAAMHVLSTMLLDAMQHATRALDYLSLLREQSVFNFCAIPQVMAIATIELMFANPDVFRRNVKIRKSQAVQLILKSVNPRDVAYLFVDFTRKMRSRLDPSDPNFVRWTVELGRIETWAETFYPTFVTAATEGGSDDVRIVGLQRYAAARTKLAEELALKAGKQVVAAQEGDPKFSAMSEADRAAQEKKDRNDLVRFFALILVAMTGFIMAVGLGGWYIAWYMTQEGTDPLTIFLRAQYHEVRAEANGYIAQASGYVQGAIASTRAKLEL